MNYWRVAHFELEFVGPHAISDSEEVGSTKPNSPDCHHAWDSRLRTGMAQGGSQQLFSRGGISIYSYRLAVGFLRRIFSAISYCHLPAILQFKNNSSKEVLSFRIISKPLFLFVIILFPWF